MSPITATDASLSAGGSGKLQVADRRAGRAGGDQQLAYQHREPWTLAVRGGLPVCGRARTLIVCVLAPALEASVSAGQVVAFAETARATGPCAPRTT